MPLVKVTVGNGQEDKENSSLSSTKEEGQASPCSSSGASCAKCPECCGSAGYENKNPEAIVASSTGAVLLKNTSERTFYQVSGLGPKNIKYDSEPKF